MEHRLFGRTDLPVSCLALGTSRFGWRTGVAESKHMLSLFREQGGNLVEACAVWCRDPEQTAFFAASSEHHVGQWLRGTPARRRELMLVGRIFLDPRLLTAPDLPIGLRLNCEASLHRLQTDYFDLLQVEWNESFGPVERLLEALWPLVRQGRVLRLGAAGFPAWRVAAANTAAERAGLPPFESVQAPFSLLDPRPFEREYSGFCDDRRLAFLAQAPLAASTLALRLEAGRPEARRAPVPPTAHQLSIRERLVLLAQRRGATPSQPELAWVLSHPGVTAAVIEPTSPGHLAELLHGAPARLSAEELHQLRHPWTPVGATALRCARAAARPTSSGALLATAPG